MRLSAQLAIAVALLLTLGGGVLLYRQIQVDGEAVAAVDRGRKAVLVELVPAAAGKVRERVEAVGTTIARQAVDVVPLTSGRVVEIAFRPGQPVAVGAVLVQLDAQMEQAAVSEVRASLREAELALERARQLRSSNNVAQATVDELEAAYVGAQARLERARKELADRTITAPFDGIVGIRGVDVGARVDDETVLTTLDDLTEVEIEFSVPEVFFGRIRPGQEVHATSAAFAGRTFTGEIATIDSRIGEISRAFRVRAVVPNPELELPAGMFMHVSVVLEERPAVLIPEQAVIAEGDSTHVFVVADLRATRREVRLGQREGGMVEVLDGLEAGEPVAKAGIQRLRDGAEVRLPDEAQAGEGA